MNKPEYKARSVTGRTIGLKLPEAWRPNCRRLHVFGLTLIAIAIENNHLWLRIGPSFRTHPGLLFKIL